jgi:hypothetical protein
MADQIHKPQSGDRSLDYVAKQDKPLQDERDKKIEKGEEKIDKASKKATEACGDLRLALS